MPQALLERGAARGALAGGEEREPQVRPAAHESGSLSTAVRRSGIDAASMPFCP